MALEQRIDVVSMNPHFHFSDSTLKKISVFMAVAENLAKLSTCSRLSVGAIIVDTRYRVIGLGYNGSPHGAPHCNTVNPEGSKEKCSCIHAEQNAVVNAGFLTDSPKLAFVTTTPCAECMKLLSSFGVTDIIYRSPYRNVEDSLKVAKEHRINVYQLM